MIINKIRTQNNNIRTYNDKRTKQIYLLIWHKRCQEYLLKFKDTKKPTVKDDGRT